VPIGTVKARMFHARQKLRQYLPTLGGGICELSAVRAAGGGTKAGVAGALSTW
jgi:hypothetical protein